MKKENLDKMVTLVEVLDDYLRESNLDGSYEAMMLLSRVIVLKHTIKAIVADETVLDKQEANVVD